MKFYHDLITQKSFQVLKKLKQDLDFVLIGGWAVWLYSHTLKSKDIDIIVSFDQLVKIKEEQEVYKNNRLKKYEAKIEEISLDIYVPFYSDLGFPLEKIKKLSVNLAGFVVPPPEILLILKQKAYQERKRSLKGRKDLIDIFSLLELPDFDWQKYLKLISQYQLHYNLKELEKAIIETREVKELKLNPHHWSHLKKTWLEKIKAIV